MKRQRILVASPRPLAGEIARHLFFAQEPEVLRVNSAEECLRVAAAEHPEIILLDAVMAGGESGSSVYTRLMADPKEASHRQILMLPDDASPGVRRGPEQPDVNRLFDLAFDLLCITDKKGRIARVNAIWEKVLGYSPAGLQGQQFLDYVHPDDREATRQKFAELLSGKKVPAFENRYVHRDGSSRWLLWNAVASPTDRFVYTVARDISEARKNSDEIRTLSRVVEQSPVSVMITDRDGNIQYVNPRFTEISGYRPGELIGRNPRVMQSGKQSREVYEKLWKTITAGRVWRGVLENRKKNGELMWEHETIAPVRDSSGAITHFVSIKEDITDRRSAEEKIRSQSALLDVATDAIMITSVDERVLYWNKGAARIYGWNKEEALGRNIRELVSPENAIFTQAKQMLLRDGHWYGEINQTTRDGKPIVVECRWSLAWEGDDRPPTLLAINSDVTEKKRLESQFLRAQRMESIGTLAGGIAHDLNNILGPILLSIDFLRSKSSDPETNRVLTALETSATRGADLVRQVLMFARGVEGEHIPLQPAHLIAADVKILAETFPRMVKISSHLPDDLWTVSGDPTQLHQVLMNLCVNARDAMPEGGQLHISAENVTLDEHYLRMNLEAKAGDHVVITVTDTGVGMPAHVIPRIFEPFYTTKEVGKGTGIGLSTVRAIVKSHGGFINVYSEPGRGSTFKVYLPVAAGERQKSPPATREEAPRGDGELILVVDDELSILDVTQAALESSGYHVLTAQDGAEALAVYSQHKQEIAVVLTDMMMPYLDGAATIRALHKINPDVKIIAASGLEVNSKVTNISSQVDAVLSKPYTGEKLLATIAQVLAKSA